MLVMGDTIFTRDCKKFTKIACPPRGAWFGNFIIGSKLRMGVIKKQYLGATSDMAKAVFLGWYIE